MLEVCEKNRENTEEDMFIYLGTIKAAEKWGDTCRLIGADAIEMICNAPDLLQAIL